MKPFIRFIRLILLTSVFFIIFARVLSGITFLNTPVIQHRDIRYLLKPNQTIGNLTKTLQQKAHLKNPLLFKLLAKLMGMDKTIQAGEYLFKTGSTPSDILNQLTAGQVIEHKFTLVNGWTFKETLQALDEAPALKHTLTHNNPAAIAKKLGITSKNPEGRFMPNTYHYIYGITDLDILRRAHQAMQNYLLSEWPRRSPDCPYQSSYKALIVASMIEKETAIPAEKPVIAGIILKRLKIWMPLQIDATVIYGLGSKYHGVITKKMLQLKTSYNTYKKYGLPPTPIATPGKDSIHAALHPKKTDFLYYVAKDNGHHVFSKTLKEQISAIKRHALRR